MGLWDRSTYAAVLAAMGTLLLIGCSAEPARQPTRMNLLDPAAVTAPAEPAAIVTPAAFPAAPSPGLPGDDYRVMSFNCRVSTLFDLHNTWGLRKGLVVDTIRTFNPDLLGTQECVAAQSDFLRREMDGYEFFGAGREDGKRGGEMCGVFYRADKFERLDAGHFWLSESPATPGTKAWGAWFPRMVTWVKLRPRDGRGSTFVWFNTHLDAFSSKARLNGAKLLRSRMASIAGRLPVVVTGDFNADAGSDLYKLLLGSAKAATRMTDTFQAAHVGVTRGDGTRHAFRGGRGGPRIDWILASTRGFQTLDADINHSRSLLGYPSDHFPVTAVLRPVGPPMLAQVE